MLKLTGLKLRNFKKHEELEIEFDDGLNVLVGPNYKGKSTVLHAILFAFFGSTAVPGGSKSIPRRGTKNSTSVELSASTPNGLLAVSRNLSGCQVLLNGKVEAEGTTPCNSFLEELLGADKATVQALGYAEQSETAALLTLGVSKTNALIEQVSRVSYVDTLIARASKKADELSDLAERFEEYRTELDSIESDISQEEASRKEASEKLQTLDTEVSEVRESLTRLKERAEKLSSNLTKLKMANLEVKSSKESLADHLESHTVIESEYKDFLTNNESPETVEQSIENLEKEYKAVVASAKDLREKIVKTTSLKATLKAKEEALEELNAKKARYDAAPRFSGEPERLEEVLKELNKVESEEASTAVSIRKVKKELSEGACNSCGRDFENFDKKAHQDMLSELEENFKEAKRKIELLVSEKCELEVKVRSVKSAQAPEEFPKWLNTAKESVEKANKELEDFASSCASEDKLKESIKDFEIKAQGVTSEKSELESVLNKFNSAKKQFDRSSKTLNDLKEKVSTAEEKLASIPEVTEESYLEIKEKVEEANSTLLEKSSALQGLKSTVEAKSSNINNLARRRTKAEDNKKKSETAAVAHKKYTAFIRWLRKSKTDFMQNIWNGILHSTSEFSRLSTDGAVTEIMRSSEGDFFFSESGEQEPLPVAGCASGGQKAIMGTGLKLALSQHLPQGFGFMLLDEPSSELNSEHTAMLSAALKSTGQQIIMVSHREADETICDNLIEI